MSGRYLIGKGELLTYPIEATRRRMSEKARPYTLSEAIATLVPEIRDAVASFDGLPPQACPDGLAVARVTLHPAFIAKSYFPKAFFDQANLTSVGSRTTRITPRAQDQAGESNSVETTEIFVAGRRSSLRRLPEFALELTTEDSASEQFAEIEEFAAMTIADRIRDVGGPGASVFEVGLHMPPDMFDVDIRGAFAQFAEGCGFVVNPEFAFSAGRLIFVAVEGDIERLDQLATFTMMRVVRPMPALRGLRPLTRSGGVSIDFALPTSGPLSVEPRVAILDGGLPDAHSLTPFVRRYFESDPSSTGVPDYLAHGLGVTSAFLFGPVEPGTVAEVPFSHVDHYRVLDAESNREDPYELYRTLAHVETVLLSRQYQFVNLSLGPDLPIEDSDVHAWTAVIDTILSDGDTVLSVAVGNNGQRDDLTGLSRIQVPSDSVNALSVGAASTTSASWDRAPYSAKGPGRSPGRRKPDLLAFGGSTHEYFHIAAPGTRPELIPDMGTSYAAPLALRSAVGIRATLGVDVHPLTIKALLIHGCEFRTGLNADDVGWGRVPSDLNDLIACDDGVARIIYQGELLPAKFLRAPVPLPAERLDGRVLLRATFCYASPVDPQDAAAYTKAGLNVTFRPDVARRAKDSANAKSATFFPQAAFRPEASLRADLGKWETVLHAQKRFLGSSLSAPVFDIHYNAREYGANSPGAASAIPYALVLSIVAPRHTDLHQRILEEHTVLQALVPQIVIPVRT